jgi:hypothetical protein
VEVTPPRQLAGRLVSLGGATLLLCAVATSAIVPAWAAGEVDDALASVSRVQKPAELRDVQRRLDRAARIDRLSVEPLLGAAAIARRRGDLLAARKYLLAAAGREPERGPTWIEIAKLEIARGDPVSARQALRRGLDADPFNRQALALVAAIVTLQAPVNESPTATGTPLPSFQPGEVPGGVVQRDGSVKLPDGRVVRRDGSVLKPDGTIVPPPPELQSAIGVPGK